MGKVNLKTILKNFLEHFESLEQSLQETTKARKEAVETRRATPPPLSLYDQEFLKLKQLTESLKSDTNCPMSEGHLDVNRKKNRYKDILPYDQSRVILSDYPGVPGSDYINANYVRGSSGNQRAYIASQGPLPSTLVDFWRMIWETEVLVVVMACNEREAGRYKCEPYWPTSTDEKQQYGNMTVELVNWRQVCPDFLVRTFKVTTETKSRTICQFHYTTWPDHGVPSSVNPILELVRLMRDVQSTESRPILVHCSAGCGRTGTICSIDYVWALLRTGKLNENFSLFEIISDMRRQRIAMVQTVEQYMLCYKAVATLFQQHLKLIDTHTYINVDDDGEPLFKINNHSDASISPDIETIVNKLEPLSQEIKTEASSNLQSSETFEKKEVEEDSEAKVNNEENVSLGSIEDLGKQGKLVGKAAVFRRSSIAKLKAIFDNPPTTSTASSSSSSTTASRTSLNGSKLYRSQSIKEDIRNLNFNFSFEFKQPQTKLKKSYTLNSGAKLTIYRKNLSIGNLKVQDDSSPTETGDFAQTKVSEKPCQTIENDEALPVEPKIAEKVQEKSELERLTDMVTYPARSVYIDHRQRSQSQLQPYRPPSIEDFNPPNAPPKPPRTYQHVVDDSCIVRTSEGRLIVTVAQPRRPTANFLPIANSGNNAQFHNLPPSHNSIYEQLRTRYKSSPNLNFPPASVSYLSPSMLQNHRIQPTQTVKRANNVTSEQFYSNVNMAKSFPLNQTGGMSLMSSDSSYPQFPTANQLKYIDVLSNQHFQHHQAKPIILQQNNYYEPIYGQRVATFVPPLPARRSNAVMNAPRPPSYSMLPPRPRSISQGTAFHLVNGGNIENIYGNREMCFNVQTRPAMVDSLPTPTSTVSSTQIVLQPKIENVYAEIGSNCTTNNANINNLATTINDTSGQKNTSKHKSNFSLKRAFKLFRSKSGTELGKTKSGKEKKVEGVVVENKGEAKVGRHSQSVKLLPSNKTAINPMNGQPMSKPPHSHRFQSATQWTQV